MKTTKLLILTCALTLNTVFAQENKENASSFPLLEGPYLGQKLPGLTAEVFAPGIVSTKHFEAFGLFTPDMKEFYFERGGGKYEKHALVVIKNENNRWIESLVALGRVGEPSISPDGKIMYLGNKYKERTDSGWSAVKSLGSSFKDIPIMRLAASSKGTYVFDERTRDGNGVLRYSRLIEDKREKPKALAKEINTGKWNAHPFIAPDESYIIWDGIRESGYGKADLYISYRQKDGSWGAAINLGDKINTEFEDAFGSVTPDGKYFFFYRGVSQGNLDIFWVDAQFIETLRPKQ